MRTSALFGAKNFEFFVIYDASARSRGVSQYGQEGKVFCADVSLTAPYIIVPNLTV